jgi:hypothetical protein
MDDRFLAEQLKRIRQLSEQMSEAQRRLGQGSHYSESQRQVHDDPLREIRDYRPYESHDYPTKPNPRRRRMVSRRRRRR